MHFVTYGCSVYTKRDMDFSMLLESNIVGYNQSLLQTFSKNCRANFGDTKCKIDKAVYGQMYSIQEIYDKTMIIVGLNKEDGYYNNGDAILADGQFYDKIASYFGNLVTLERLIPNNIQNNKIVKLIPNCDKKFITCCNKFNNAINFRGEPFIPEDNFIKVI